MTSSEMNICIRIARGDIKGDKTKLSEEQKNMVEKLKERFKELRDNGLEGMVNAYCVDDDSL